jgi:hypothetical protein
MEESSSHSLTNTRLHWRDWVVLLAFVVITLGMTYPLVFRLGTHAVGDRNDMWVSHWNNWWGRRALVDAINPYQTSYMFYPQGVSLVWHSFSWSNMGLWLLLSPLTGSLAAHGITVLLTYVLGGFTTYLLALEVTGSRKAAFLAGLISAFFPYRFADRNHIKFLTYQWIPLFMLYLMRVTRRGRLGDGIKSGLALALCGLSSVQLMIMSSMWGAVWLLFSLLAERRDWSRRTVLALLLAGLVCGAIVAPFFAPLVAARLDPNLSQGLVASDTGGGDVNLLDFVSVSGFHSLVREDGALSQWIDTGSEVAIGYTVLALAACAVLKRWPKARFWVISTLLFGALALGSKLRVGSLKLPAIPAPYQLLASTIVGESIRKPERFCVLLGVSVAVVASAGFAAILDRMSQRWWRYVVAALVGTLILFEYWVAPFPLTAPIQSPFYADLRDEPGQFAVADFPIGFHAHDKWYMYAQTLHGRPMVGGHVSRVPIHAHDFMDAVPLLTAARAGVPTKGTLDDVSRQLEPLSENEVRYVLVHKYRLGADAVDRWKDWFVARPHYEDEYLVVYNTAPHYGRDFEFKEDVGDGIGVIGTSLSAETISQGGAVEVEIVWGSAQAPEREWVGYVELDGSAGREAQRVVFEPCAGWSTAEWGRDAIARSHVVLGNDPFLESGAYTVTLGLFDAATGESAGNELEVGHVEVTAIARAFTPPDVKVEYEAVFGDALQLRGYGLRQSDEQLDTVLHWRSLHRMDVDYKFFVHLVNVDSGERAAQADVMPRDWTYPTTWWEAGEYVSDSISLSLVDVPAGTYRLEVGVYDPDTGVRLPVSLSSEQQAAEDRLILPEVVKR